MFFLRGDIEQKPPVFIYVSFMISRKGVCALCCRCESLSCVGPGLPDDLSPPQSSVLYTLCATETLDFSKQRLPATAYSAGQKTARERVKGVKMASLQNKCIELSSLSQQWSVSPLTPFRTVSIYTIYTIPCPLLV